MRRVVSRTIYVKDMETAGKDSQRKEAEDVAS